MEQTSQDAEAFAQNYHLESLEKVIMEPESDYLLTESYVEKEDDTQESGTNSDEEDLHFDYFPGELVGPCLSFSKEELYHCYSFQFKQNFSYDVPLRDITLLVKSDLGTDFVSTEFQMQVRRGFVTLGIEYTGTIHLSAEQVRIATRFQITILRLLIDHKLSKLKDALYGHLQEEGLARISYLLVPSISSQIDWDCVSSTLFCSNVVCSSSIAGGYGIPCCSCPKEDIHLMRTKDGSLCSCMLRNSLVFTQHNERIYCITGILDDLNGDSTMKLNSRGVLTYKEYFQRRHGITLSHSRESLLSGRQLFTLQNCLLQRPFGQKEKESSNADVELPPELCEVLMSPITISTLYSFSFVPSVMHRIKSMLLAMRLKQMQMNHCTQNVVPAIKVLEAITTKKCQEEFSLESLETLGDSFLKYAVCQQLFRDNTHDNEGLLSSKKERMISNTALYKLGCERKLPGFIRNECFDPKCWVIPGEPSGCFVEDDKFFSTSKTIYKRGTRHMEEKAIADVVEALIGAYLSQGGELAALFFINWLGMKVDFVKELSDGRPFLVKPEIYTHIKHLESVLNYSFREPSLLVEALTHGSYQDPDIPRCYQRLEFLGDSLLDYLFTIHFYNTNPGLSPGLLTDLRSASVNNECYANAAVKAKLNNYILIHASSELRRQITSFVQNFEQSFTGSSFGWESETAVPKVLGDVIESIAGAILIDSGFNKEAVFERIMPVLEPLVTPETIKYQPVKELELLSRGKIKFIDTSNNGIARITVEAEVDGVFYRKTCIGENKKTAEKLAAKAVLETLKKCSPGI
ncbi:endoribonuclease Dicer homolog 2-like [Tasmannia lanceolata]|uniref:endoribonuclease Dicer homolog 2-like n=1 Tax=Tasmannia lanceolata TaxID=3420 RepID=UPI004062A98D